MTHPLLYLGLISRSSANMATAVLDNFTIAKVIHAHISNVAVFNDARWQHNLNAILTKQNVAPCIRIIEG